MKDPNSGLSFSKAVAYWPYNDLGDLVALTGQGDAQLLNGHESEREITRWRPDDLHEWTVYAPEFQQSLVHFSNRYALMGKHDHQRPESTHGNEVK